MSEVKSDFHVDEKGNPTGGSSAGPGLMIKWQSGPLGPGGLQNGATVEDVLEACSQRLEHLNGTADGRFRCIENARAIQNIGTALRWLEIRTVGRRKRGVEGTNRP